MLDRLVDLIAPRRRADFILRAASVMVVVNAVNVAVNVWVKGMESVPPLEYLVASTVAFPFIILALALLQRQRRLQEQLAALAMTDMLTGLPNRRGFEAAAARTPPAAVIVADIDHFKRINDSFGHAAGDSGLRQVSERLRTSLRPGEFVARIGGEEFGILITADEEERVAAIAARLVNPFSLDLGGDLPGPELTLSCGVAYARDGDEVCKLVNSADRALYRAKSAGRARLVVDGEPEPIRPMAIVC
ncbi:GGDEF domain-containing protein [Pseudoroseicyclus tamaricis]|uniref:diguanylate cyclase n=1 Tax=Pseudoroseicyclus tamaricis TaxID=2705421 RepID=A0A6B2JX46_9RHOB|nr:GGDEF domain-containing protein [Pseudoroseicyclus tamaricis]NDV00804.1 GGDEF domain-containing protein [Pseudoroseicyclus tamaricis]